MARTVTLSSLRTQARQRADMENSQFVSDTELNTYINSSGAELYDLLTTVYEDYYYSTYSITSDGVNDTYALPSNFYKLVGVDEVLNGSTGQSISIKPYVFAERNSYTKFKQSGVTLNLLYIPTFTTLALDADTLDGVNGWEEYVIVDAAIKMAQKEESDVQVLAAQKLALIQRINNSASNRDAGQTLRVTDIHQVDPYAYIQIPSRLRYHLLAGNIKFVEHYASGVVYA